MTYFIISGSLAIALLIIRAAIGNTSGVSKVEFGFSKTPGNRQVNADEIDWAYYDEEIIFTVADGIGSGGKAQNAAMTAVRIISRVFERSGTGGNPAYFFVNCFKGVNSTILRYIPDGTAGASLLTAVIKDGLLYYALAGNCKLSVFRDGEFYEISEGHTFDVLVRRAFRRQEITRTEALEAIKESRLYNFVGKDGFRNLEVFDIPVSLKKGDIILLMTDGIYEFCSSDTLSEILSTGYSCQALAKRITDTLDKENHPQQDNASVIVARMNNI